MNIHVVGSFCLFHSPCHMEATFPPKLKHKVLVPASQKAQLEEALATLALTLAKGLESEGDSAGLLSTIFLHV